MPGACLLPNPRRREQILVTVTSRVASRPSSRHGARRACWALCLALGLAVSSAAQTRVVAVGDVHGAYPEFVGILQRAGLINADRQWIDGSSVLVQTGDVPDRGARSRECLDLLMELERQAKKHQGRVVALLGNHEVMNILGDLRYVSPQEYQSFATERSEQVRQKAYQKYRKFLAARNRRRRLPAVPDDEASRRKWMQEHPLGFFEHRDAYGPKGLYGRWLRKHNVVAQVGDVIFLHGGLDPKHRFRSLKALNNKIRFELASFDLVWRSLSDMWIIWRYMRLEEALREVRDELEDIRSGAWTPDKDTLQKMQKLLGVPGWLVFVPDGPLWYRGYAQEPEETLQPEVEAMLERLKARYLVVGHTPTPSRRVTQRLGHRVFLIDTGMQRAHYQGRAAALEIRNGRFTAYYTNGEPQVLLAPGGAAGAPALTRGPDGADRRP